MKRKHQKLKSAGAFLTILLLLPYVITVFVNGIDVLGMSQEPCVRAERRMQDGERVVRTVPWSEYMIGVLGKTMPASYEKEALKAQAVVLRTMLYQQVAQEQNVVFKEAYLTSEELKKKWGAENFEQYYKKLREVQDETESQVLFYQDTYAWVPYHQASNGKTRSGKEVIGEDTYPYLAVRECPEDMKAEDEMHIYQFSYGEIKKKCRSFLEAAEGEAEAKKALKFEDFEIQEKDSAGYVSRFRIGNTICTGDEFRDAMSLASSAFSIQEDPNGLKITTMGRGHGLGMSQWTANEMAKNGKNYKEILEFFFEGTMITNSEEILEKTE
ncbi:SpoIID/LytB domain-containing protein [Mediterraneibacter gnavus]|uniref:SpoIID/LytB domain-containing protein n=1 Tax=Mediterraneibacter gnavus TaxID=33038 RepID=UPI000464545E|nr:SpoIID/LytB domain-containing protein [Mediterraneibacter gnavus]MDB8710693.1 SpoIID/LytB domain-containing protein [Mediterraneibacter gnavus]MDB8713841.1 SpoIID/LytB domain-containing protein [Mediterraneibacter gnavus]